MLSCADTAVDGQANRGGMSPRADGRWAESCAGSRGQTRCRESAESKLPESVVVIVDAPELPWVIARAAGVDEIAKSPAATPEVVAFNAKERPARLLRPSRSWSLSSVRRSPNDIKRDKNTTATVKSWPPDPI